LSAGVAARVDGDSISTAFVRDVANAENVTLPEARRRAVSDALFAAEARDRFGPFAARAAERRGEARALLDDVSRRAEATGPPTDAEVEAATERRFWELDRPTLLRTTHACVLVKDPKDDGPARVLAERIFAAVAHTSDPQAFRAAALAVPRSRLDVRVEDLLPVAEDGRAVDPDAPPPPGSTVARYSERYVRAAFAIPAVGQVSPVVRTEFGYHVILAVARIAEHRVPLEERRRLLEPEILVRRKELALEAVLDRARGSDPVVVERSASELSEKARVTE